MEYCEYGQLYEVLQDGKKLPQELLITWAKQIAGGMSYLHSHKIIHRDLKSPNVLITKSDTIKISDFGTSREWNEKSTKMSFAGTVAWMAPEVIRNEPCSEKVDIWSFGVVLWELMTHEIPYRDVDSSAIIWGVGSNSLHLPLPTSCPDGFKLLMRQCWNSKPRNRPSFYQILMHLEIASPDWLNIPEEDFYDLQVTWKEEIREKLQKIKSEGSHYPQLEEELVRRRKEELRHAQDVREHYERKLERANNLYMELTACMLQLEKRERELIKREQALQVFQKRRKSILKPVIKAQQQFERFSRRKSQKCVSDPGTSPETPPPNGILYPVIREVQDNYQTSPSRIRRKKGLGRKSSRNSPLVSNSPKASPTKDALHAELHRKTAAVQLKDGNNVTPSSFRYLGPATAIRDIELDYSHISQHHQLSDCDHEGLDPSRNLNDVCFGCHGGCSDATCSSKRSSRVSADVESNACDDVPSCASPTQGLHSSHHGHDPQVKGQDQGRVFDFEGHKVRDMEANTDSKNKNYSSPLSDANEPGGGSDKNGNSQSNSPIKRTQRSPKSPSKSCKSPKSPRSPRTRIKKMKRLRSSSDAPDESPSKKGNTRGSRESLGSEARSRGSRTADSSSSNAEESEDDVRQSRARPSPAYHSTFSSEGVLSEDNEENTSEHYVRNTPDQLLSSLSAENLQLELSKCSSDGLSDKENVVRNLKNQVKHSVDKLAPPPLDDSELSSDSDGCSGDTVSSIVAHKPQTPLKKMQKKAVRDALQNGW